MGGSSKQKTQSQSTQQTTLNPQYQTLSNQILQNAQTAAASPAQQQTQTAANNIIAGGLDQLQKTVNGDYLDGSQNPTLANLVASQQQQVYDQLQHNIQTIGDVSQQQGAYGGSRQGVTEGVAQAQYAKDALDAANQIYYNNYNTERNNQVNAATTLQSYLDAQNSATNGANNNLATLLAILAPYNSTTSGSSSGTTTTSANPVEQAIQLASIFNGVSSSLGRAGGG